MKVNAYADVSIEMIRSYLIKEDELQKMIKTGVIRRIVEQITEHLAIRVEPIQKKGFERHTITCHVLIEAESDTIRDFFRLLDFRSLSQQQLEKAREVCHLLS